MFCLPGPAEAMWADDSYSLVTGFPGSTPDNWLTVWLTELLTWYKYLLKTSIFELFGYFLVTGSWVLKPNINNNIATTEQWTVTTLELKNSKQTGKLQKTYGLRWHMSLRSVTYFLFQVLAKVRMRQLDRQIIYHFSLVIDVTSS